MNDIHPIFARALASIAPPDPDMQREAEESKFNQVIRAYIDTPNAFRFGGVANLLDSIAIHCERRAQIDGEPWAELARIVYSASVEVQRTAKHCPVCAAEMIRKDFKRGQCCGAACQCTLEKYASDNEMEIGEAAKGYPQS